MKKITLFLLFLFVIAPIKADDLECVAGDYELYAIFTPKTITCDTDQFLPANSETCSNCPTGYTCTGGTFIFNEQKSQGIDFTQKISNSGNSVCSVNFPSELYATFRPKTITLTYNDGVGNTSSGTCTYDGLVTLPEPPTRPGYTFTGWKLQTNSE